MCVKHQAAPGALKLHHINELKDVKTLHDFILDVNVTSKANLFRAKEARTKGQMH